MSSTPLSNTPFALSFYLQLYNNLPVDFPLVLRGNGFQDLLKRIHPAINGNKPLCMQKREDSIDRLLRGEIGEETGQINTVWDVLDGIEAGQRINPAQQTRLADDSTLFHSGQRIDHTWWL